MLLKVSKAKAIKPNVVRFGFEVWFENHIVGEGDVAMDINAYITETDEGDMSFDFSGWQQELTNLAAGLQSTSQIASKLINAEWNVATEENKED
jgi:hypothetical protein